MPTPSRLVLHCIIVLLTWWLLADFESPWNLHLFSTQSQSFFPTILCPNPTVLTSCSCLALSTSPHERLCSFVKILLVFSFPPALFPASGYHHKFRPYTRMITWQADSVCLLHYVQGQLCIDWNIGISLYQFKCTHPAQYNLFQKASLAQWFTTNNKQWDFISYDKTHLSKSVHGREIQKSRKESRATCFWLNALRMLS